MTTQEDRDKRAENLIKIWERAVQTQMHFNEMSVKTRQLGFTLVGAALAAAAYTLNKDENFLFNVPVPWGDIRIHVAFLLALVSAATVFAIRSLDLGVYHQMLRGAVTFGEDFERNHLAEYLSLEKGMTESISHFSRYSDAKAELKNGKNNYQGKVRRNAGQKLGFFYNTVISVVLGFAVFVLIVSNLGDRVTKLEQKPDSTTIEMPKKDVSAPKSNPSPDLKK